jgi:hypothetical protein
MLSDSMLRTLLNGDAIDVSGLSLDELEFASNVYMKLYWNEKYNLKKSKYFERLSRVSVQKREKYQVVCTCCGKKVDSGTAYMEITHVVPEDYVTEYKTYCGYCAKKDRTDKVFYEVSNYLNARGYPENLGHSQDYMRNGCMLMFGQSKYVFPGGNIHIYRPKFDIHAYTDGGSIVFKLDREMRSDALIDPIYALEQMWEIDQEGKFVCTSCGKMFTKDKIAGYPLFAGRVCPECWKKHLEYLEEERKNGHICRMCRRPYSDCAC